MKIKNKLVAILIVLALALPLAFAACGTKLAYTGSTLANGSVGVAYTASVATATGAEGITYALKDGSSLPAGLALSESGAISGTPTEVANAAKFTVVATADGNSVEAEFTITIEKTAMTYEGGTVTATINEAADLSVATATGPSGITYTLKSGTLPAGLTFDNGRITGTATALSEGVEIVVTASAEGFDPVDATWTVVVALPALTYESFETTNAGTVGVFYTTMINTATGASGITYAVAEGSAVPDGLTLASDGFVSGKVSERGRYEFDVTASADGYTSATATVTILFRDFEGTTSDTGTITYAPDETDIEGAMEGAAFVSLASDADAVVALASASNYATVTYEVTAGTLPEGLTLYEDGTLYGTPAARGDYEFTVTASAEGCDDVAVEFTMEVAEPMVSYESVINIPGTFIVGEAMEYDLGTATAGDEEVTYAAMRGIPLPAGLTLSADGVLSGTPTASAKQSSFIVIASAEGYSDAQCEVVMVIRDGVTEIENGRMEAEYIDLSGKIGSGYSGGAQEAQMIQKASTTGIQGVSNDRFIGYTHTVISFDFKFTASAADDGVTIIVGLGSELGDVTFTTAEFSVRLNGEEIAFQPMAMTGATAGSWGDFKAYTITTNASLVEGENTITLSVLPNTFLRNQTTGGPGIDYVEVDTDATLTWSPHLYNIIGR